MDEVKEKELEAETKKELENETKKEPEDGNKKEPEDGNKKELEDVNKKELEDETKKEPEDETKKELENETKKEPEDGNKKEPENETKKELEDETKKEPKDETKKEQKDGNKKEPENETKKEPEDETKKEQEEETKKEKDYEENIFGYKDFLEKNVNSQNCLTDQEKTSENTHGDECLDNNKEQKEDKFSKTYFNKDEITTIFKNINFQKTSLSEIYLILIGYVNTTLNAQKQKEGKTLIGKKRSTIDDAAPYREDISKFSGEIKIEETLIDITTQIAINYVEVFNKIYLTDYNFELSIDKNMMSQNLYVKDILEKNLEDIILLNQENSLQKKELIEKKKEAILKKENKIYNKKFIDLLQMKIIYLLDLYINNKVIKFNNCKLKLLKDNEKYNKKQRNEIKKRIKKYLKESNLNNVNIELTLPQSPSNLIPLSNDEAIGNDEIKNCLSIKKNGNQNIYKKAQKDEEHKANEESGNRLENLVRMTIDRNYKFNLKEIEKLLDKINKKIKIVKIYKYIAGNSTERFKDIFDKKFSDILEKNDENRQYIKDIFNDNRDLKELKIVKELLNMNFLDRIEKFLKDEALYFLNGNNIKINIFEYIEFNDEIKKYKNMTQEQILKKKEEEINKYNEISARIKEKMEEIKEKIENIIKTEKRMRDKKK